MSNPTPTNSNRPWQFADTAALMSWAVPVGSCALAAIVGVVIIVFAPRHVPLWWVAFLVALVVGPVLATVALVLNPGEQPGKISWVILQAILGYVATLCAAVVIMVLPIAVMVAQNIKNPALLEEQRVARRLAQEKQQAFLREQQQIAEEERRSKQAQEYREAEAAKRKAEFDKSANAKRYALAMIKRLATGEDGQQLPSFSGDYIPWHDHATVNARVHLPTKPTSRPLVESEQVSQGWRVRKLKLAGSGLIPALAYIQETSGKSHVYLTEKKGTLLEISPTDWKLQREVDLGGPCVDMAGGYSQVLVARTQPGSILYCEPSSDYPERVSTLVFTIAQVERVNLTKDDFDLEIVTGGSEPLWAVVNSYGGQPDFIRKVAEAAPPAAQALFDPRQRLRPFPVNKETRQFLAARKDGIYRGAIPGQNNSSWPLNSTGQISFDEKYLQLDKDSGRPLAEISWQKVLSAPGLNTLTFAATERGTFFTSSDKQNLLLYGGDGKQLGAWQWPGAGKTLYIGVVRGTSTCVVLTEQGVFVLTPDAGNAPPPGTKYVKHHLAVEFKTVGANPAAAEPFKLELQDTDLAAGAPGVKVKTFGRGFSGSWLYDPDGKGLTLLRGGQAYRVDPTNWSISKDFALQKYRGFEHLQHSAAGLLGVTSSPIQVVVLDRQTFALKQAWGLTGNYGSSYVTSADFVSSPHHNFVAFLLESGENFEVMDVTTGGVVAEMKAAEAPGQREGDTTPFYALAMSPDGKNLFALTNRIHRYAVTPTGIQHKEMSEPFIDYPQAVSISGDGRRLLMQCEFQSWVYATDPLARPLHELKFRTRDDAILNPSGEFVWTYLEAGDQNYELAQLDLSGKVKRQLKLQPLDTSLKISPDGKRVFFGPYLVELAE